jgi:predicted RNA-binding Zn-ribbon protein involved in translation (DUF1610 family)
MDKEQNKMPKDREENIAIGQDDFYQVACVNCGETVFKFSRFTILETESIEFRCPKCNKTTIVSITSSGGLEVA